MKVDEWYALKFQHNGNYVALNMSSGGYPTPVKAGQSHRFKSLEDAWEYARKFKAGYFRIVKLTVSEGENG